MDEDENVSIWHKKADELTVGESLEVSLIVTAVIAGATVAFFGALGFAAKIAERRQAKKETKLKLIQDES